MIILPLMLGSVLALAAQEPGECPERPYALQETEKRDREARDLEHQLPLKAQVFERRDDLWYATPGVRPGGDLLKALWDLLRRPSDLLDFRARRVPSWLPDRETLEFLQSPR